MKRQPGFVFDVLDELEKGKINSFLDMHAVTCSTEKNEGENMNPLYISGRLNAYDIPVHQAFMRI